MAQDDAWQRDHQRKTITLRAGWPEDARPEVERVVHGLLGWLAGDHGVVDVSVWELAELGKHPAPEVHAALADLVRQGFINVAPVEGPGAAPGIRDFQASCPMGCGHWLKTIHRRVLEHELRDHLAQAHGSRLPIDLTPPARRGTVH